MPTQSLEEAPAASERPATSPLGVGGRRALVLGATLATTAVGAWGTCRVLMFDTLSVLDLGVLTVFVALFAWTTFWFVLALAGLVVSLGRRRDPLGIDPHAPLPRLRRRTAILAPVYNEETEAVFAGLQAIHESVEATGQGDQFDLFVLSDSTKPAVRAAERRAFEQLRRQIDRPGAVFYRNRTENLGRKAGNVADWVRRFGGAYAYMVVLDADSLMTGDSLVRLAGAMDEHPGVGLIQTLPLIVNRESLFGRTVQFASRLYGPLLSQGLAWWSGSEGNYWGHNAIIRVKAFAGHAGLPELEGPSPFGGQILSHDFVEAALIRRAGYAVHAAPQLRGSYEECPPTLAALMTRDRRWCQGNLQHVGILRAKGLHWISRLHLFNGAFAYATSPLWLVLLCMSVLLPMRPELGGVVKHLTLGSLAIRSDLAAAGWIFTASMTFLLAHKLLAYAAAMVDPEQRRAYGGVVRAFAGVLIETLISALIAPVMMLSQTRGLIDILLGRDSGWNAQDRSEGKLSLAKAARCHGWHTAAGIVLGLFALAASPAAFLWLSPVLLGLVLSVPVAALIADCDLGLAAKRWGLLVTPEESAPPEIVERANQLVARFALPPVANLAMLRSPSGATLTLGPGRVSALAKPAFGPRAPEGLAEEKVPFRMPA